MYIAKRMARIAQLRILWTHVLNIFFICLLKQFELFQFLVIFWRVNSLQTSWEKMKLFVLILVIWISIVDCSPLFFNQLFGLYYPQQYYARPQNRRIGGSSHRAPVKTYKDICRVNNAGTPHAVSSFCPYWLNLNLNLTVWRENVRLWFWFYGSGASKKNAFIFKLFYISAIFFYYIW